MLSQHELISALTALPAGEFAEVVSLAIEKREPRVRTQPEAPGGLPGGGARTSPRSRCCGLTFTSHAKKAFCPLCGKRVSLN